MRYEIRYAETKCFAEDLHEKTMSVGKYFVVNPNENDPLSASHKITVKVMPPKGESLLHEADNVEAGQFSFTAYDCMRPVLT
ncbi:unnamed protein product [Microthlaspi erraticum]|uniref:GOLD domain-containing protein n=1 Tax=Microthlaspi erraticum TaxID=1685480 RepID=A0A6D2J486_9BRAS|nr:unnamed protein product [Microthlaspi erraticum]CAA7049691.1 unnamed protein product [Microthlaspi erraticum]